MRKLLTVAFLFTLLSCKKNSQESPTVSVQGTLHYGNPAADGPGWYILSDSNPAREYFILESSIPTNFKNPNINVLASLKETNIPYRGMSPAPSNIHYYSIVTIKKI